MSTAEAIERLRPGVTALTCGGATARPQDWIWVSFEMKQRYGQYRDEPRVGGGLIGGFLLVVLACLGAFGATSVGVFEAEPLARLTVAPGRLDSVIQPGLAPQGKVTRETRS